MRNVCLLAALACLSPAPDARGQDAPPGPPATIRVFVDCNDTPCDQDFFKTELAFVEHVRDRQTADVHVLMTGQPTGSGGREITFSFYGQGRFTGRDQVLKDTFVVAASDDDVRRGMVRVMALGLVPYLLDTAAAGRLTVTARAASTSASQSSAATAQADDPWNRWSLRVNLNGNANGEHSTKYAQFDTNVNANRTTDETKVNLNANMNYRQNSYKLPDGRTFVSPNRDYGLNGMYVKSLDGHWSAGVRANWNSSTFSNQDFTWFAGPGIEWDLFPYVESTRRLVTFNYSVGVRAWDYEAETIYGKLEERRAVQTLEATVSLRQRWGTVGASAEAASFVPDVGKNHVGFYGNLSLNLVRGLSLNLNTSINSIRDQITLPRAEATTEEVLVSQRELATTYRYFVYFGISYTFGSIFSPIVNPRFGGGG